MPSRKWMKKKILKSISMAGSSEYASFVRWRTYYLQGTDCDRWTQRDSAIRYYQLLIEDIQLFLRTGETSTNETTELNEEQRETASKIAYCLGCRLTALQHPDEKHWMTLEELMKMKPVLKHFLNWEGVFPILMIEQPNTSKISLLSQDSGLSELHSSDDDDDEYDDNMLTKLPRKRGLSRFSIKILKFGVKDVKKLTDPYILISLRDRDSVNLSQVQKTGVASRIEDYHAEFNTRLELQRYIEKIPKGSALFFELKNTNERKTIYYALLTNEQFTNGNAYLELYKGPVDFHRKRFKKVSATKPLYLHLEMTIN